MRQAADEVLVGLQGERTAASGRPATSDRVRELVEAKLDGLHIQTCGTASDPGSVCAAGASKPCRRSWGAQTSR